MQRFDPATTWAGKILEVFRRNPGREFRRRDLEGAMGLTCQDPYIGQVCMNLTRAGLVVRIRPGVYRLAD